MSLKKVSGPTSWINLLVAVEKPNADICLDMRQANRAILREKHPVPTVDETLQEISQACDVTMFATPEGLYQYKRLLFGVNMATEKFQQLIGQILKDCPGAYNLHVDVILVGRDHEEHVENLNKVTHKFEEH